MRGGKERQKKTLRHFWESKEENSYKKNPERSEQHKKRGLTASRGDLEKGKEKGDPGEGVASKKKKQRLGAGQNSPTVWVRERGPGDKRPNDILRVGERG